MKHFGGLFTAVPVLVLFSFVPMNAFAAGLNTNVALSPPQGGTIIRVQWRYTELFNDPTPLDRKTSLSVNPITVVYGVTSDFSLLATLPVVHREVDVGMTGNKIEDTGFADIPLQVKYRFYQDDLPGITTRWAVIGGVEVPTFDGSFSSESYDPIIGTVWTHQRRDWWVDLDVLYKFNTAGNIAGDDELRGDVALSYRLFGGENKSIGPWGLYAIGEINVKYITDGSTQVFGSPGIQFIMPQWILEAGVQLPIHQEIKSPRLETDFTFVLSLRFQF